MYCAGVNVLGDKMKLSFRGLLVLCGTWLVAPSVAAQSSGDSAGGRVELLPGGPTPAGLSLSPEAPPVPPAAGGRAPSFGAPTTDDVWTFRLNGRISGWQAFGIGERPSPAPEGYSGTPLHVPAMVQGKQPFWSGAGFSLFTSYGNSKVQAVVNFHALLSGQERQGFYNPSNGPQHGSAYLNITPEPIGNLRLQAKVGAFTEAFGSPGQWGWGIYGPLLALRGYGETLRGEYTYSQDTRFTFAHGFVIAPRFEEDFVRGTYTGWTEVGRSTFVHHAHAGFSYKNVLTMNLHAAFADGTDEREWLGVTTPAKVAAGTANLAAGEDPIYAEDGDMNVYILDGRYLADPYGQVGASVGVWDFTNGFAVHDGIWWGIDWTQGGREMLNKFVGPASGGDGTLVAVSAEYNLSLARLLWYPRAFDGRSPDVRINVAGIKYWAAQTDDPDFRGSGGHMLGTEIEYQMTSWFSTRLRAYGETRHTALGPWHAYSASPGISFRRDWSSRDRIELWYSRHFYSRQADANPAEPLDRNILALGATLEF